MHIHEIDTLRAFLAHDYSLKNVTLQDIDFTGLDINWEAVKVDNTTFLGCNLPLEAELVLRRKGAYLYFHPKDHPYRPYRKELYTWRELMKGWSAERDDSLDYRIYRHFSKHRAQPNINEALVQRIHDHSIDEALRELVGYRADGMTEQRCVGIMGGHSTPRTDPFYERTVRTAKLLTEAGYLVVTGGGPGIMEAGNLGAYLAGKSEEDLLRALRILQRAPHYTDAGFHEEAFDVIGRYPAGAESLAIPTWFYGHEPSNVFASHIAKYFSNSIREDNLLAVCLHGIVFAPGSAGTTQEIFQDATQNHYGTFRYYSPMVFLGSERYEIHTLIYPLLRQLAYGRAYADLLHLTDAPEAVVTFLQAHPPVPVEN